MNSDFTTIIGHLSQSLIPVQTLISGSGYLFGILLMIVAITKLRKVADSRSGGGGHEKIFIPIAYLIGGAALIFLPSSISVLSNTAFGTNNVLQYSSFNPYDIFNAMKIVIKTAGLLWFVRGCILLVHSSNPGVQEGPKGLVFLCAGVLAMNFEGSMGMLNYALTHLIAMSLTIKNNF